ncbi:sodium channel, voltage-gated, type I, beta a [Aplochiton taeniatus]
MCSILRGHRPPAQRRVDIAQSQRPLKKRGRKLQEGRTTPWAHHRDRKGKHLEQRIFSATVRRARMLTVQRMTLALVILAIQATLGGGACVEVDSDTEAVVNEGFKLGCISCKMRGEVSATARVDWYFTAYGEKNASAIYGYEDQQQEFLDDRFYDRLAWNGSKKTNDLQDGSIYILNITYNDTGTFRCVFTRVLTFQHYEFQTTATKLIHITVVDAITRGMASILSEVMMYVTIIGLQLWLVVEMVYCYRKISAAGEEALRESAAEYLAIASESKENCSAALAE